MHIFGATLMWLVAAFAITIILKRFVASKDHIEVTL